MRSGRQAAMQRVEVARRGRQPTSGPRSGRQDTRRVRARKKTVHCFSFRYSEMVSACLRSVSPDGEPASGVPAGQGAGKEAGQGEGREEESSQREAVRSAVAARETVIPSPRKSSLKTKLETNCAGNTFSKHVRFSLPGTRRYTV